MMEAPNLLHAVQDPSIYCCLYRYRGGHIEIMATTTVELDRLAADTHADRLFIGQKAIASFSVLTHIAQYVS